MPLAKEPARPFEIKILTPNPKALKILPSNFAEAAPVKAFRGVGEGGPPEYAHFPKMNPGKIRAPETKPTIFPT
jgi:hypothetical protein